MRVISIIVVLLVACALCVPVAAQQAVEDTTKSVIVTMHYRDGTVTPVSSRVVYGPPPDNLANTDMLTDLVGKDGRVIGSYGIEDPRVLYYEGGAAMETDVEFAVILPFDAGASRVDLYDGATKEKLASADISGAIGEFCSAHKDDPDCGAGGAGMLVYATAIVIVLVIIGAAVYLLKGKKVKPEEAK